MLHNCVTFVQIYSNAVRVYMVAFLVGIVSLAIIPETCHDYIESFSGRITSGINIEMSARVYVGRLSFRAQERDVERFFRGYGHISEVLMKNVYAFVEFTDYRDADDAVRDLNGRSLFGDR